MVRKARYVEANKKLRGKLIEKSRHDHSSLPIALSNMFAFMLNLFEAMLGEVDVGMKYIQQRRSTFSLTR